MTTSLTVILIIISVVCSLYAWHNQNILYKWIFNPYRIRSRREYFRFITSGFIHNDYIHLIFNMLVLYIFGLHVEFIFSGIFGSYGPIIFLALYLLGIIISDIPTYLKYKDLPHYNSLGASGGVSSILFSFILFNPTADLCLYGISFLCLPAFVWAAAYIIYSYYMSKRAADNVNHDAHLFGGLFGVIFTIIIYPRAVVIFFQNLSEYSIF